MLCLEKGEQWQRLRLPARAEGSGMGGGGWGGGYGYRECTDPFTSEAYLATSVFPVLCRVLGPQSVVATDSCLLRFLEGALFRTSQRNVG